ncbi:hypothetical protein AVEN_226875-1 [Araneus ventricosus]|uniref:Uncharacterized protein n=1 Tax=Araneus ventricosus TaxID=182803 RepID=A0A4Y2HAG8_ARAVE|nr:hypothetical protein AVEN_226875-1 [Araneus ventricosus]
MTYLQTLLRTSVNLDLEFFLKPRKTLLPRLDIHDHSMPRKFDRPTPKLVSIVKTCHNKSNVEQKGGYPNSFDIHLPFGLPIHKLTPHGASLRDQHAEPHAGDIEDPLCDHEAYRKEEVGRGQEGHHHQRQALERRNKISFLLYQYVVDKTTRSKTKF